ncbi:hypothetical protein ACWCQX_51605, partial [Streptomyces sp. NPDC002346]
HKAMQETRPRPGVLLDLVPRNGFLPDFLQQPTARDFATALDLVTATSAEQLALVSAYTCICAGRYNRMCPVPSVFGAEARVLTYIGRRCGRRCGTLCQ